MPEAIPATSPRPAEPPEPSPAGTPRIPDYELLRIIGRGSYGDVWLARGITGLFRAVKLVWRDRFPDPQPYEREFKGLREFAAISLSESRQLALLHVGRNEAAGFFYYVMELADDVETGSEIDPDRYVPHTLKETRERQGRRPAAEVVALGVELSRALAGLHARGLVHRDVKPSNVIFVGGAPKLADIGLVTAATTAHTFVGTEGFVPPEGPGTPAADVFSLGKLLYETATGLDRHDYPRLPANLSELPDRKELLELNEILIRACDPAAAQRYTDAAALLDDLLLLQAGRSMRRLRAAERRLTRAVRIGAALALVAAVAGAGAFVERRRAESENTLRRQAEAARDELARKMIYSAGLARAQRSLELGDLGRARQQLQELAPKPGDPDLRGFEWHALWFEAQGDPAEVLRESGPAAEKVRFSPDGQWLAVHTSDKRVTLWDAATKKIVRTVEGIHRLAGFSADGVWLVGTDPTFALQRWRVADGTPDTQPSPGTNRPIAALGNDRIVCFTDAPANEPGTPHVLRVWDFAQRTDVTRIEIPTAPDGTRWDFFRAAVSADGTTCAFALINGRVPKARWKLQSFDLPAQRSIHDEPMSQRPVALGLSSDGAQLAVAFSETVDLSLRNLGTGMESWRRPVGASPVNVIEFSPDNSRLIVACRDPIVRVLDTATGGQRQEFRGHAGEILSANWNVGETRLASVSNAGDVRLWSQMQRVSRRSASGFWSSPTGDGMVIASADGRRLAAHRNAQQIDLLDVETLDPLATIAASRPIAFSAADGSLLALTARNELQRYGATGSAVRFDAMALFPNAILGGTSITENERWFAASDHGRVRVRIWRFPSGDLVQELPAHREHLRLVELSPNGELVATAGADTRVRIWRTATGTLYHEWTSSDITSSLAFSRDGKWLAHGLSNGDVELHRSSDFTPIMNLRTGARASALVFSPDGSRLLCGDSTGFIHVFATKDWQEVLALTAAITPGASNKAISSLALSSDGTVLAAFVADGTVRVWRTR